MNASGLVVEGLARSAWSANSMALSLNDLLQDTDSLSLSIYIYTHIHIYIYTYVHTYIYIHVFFTSCS